MALRRGSLTGMTYTTAEGRAQVLDVLAAAADDLGLALACLGEAYEQLDEHSADRLEELLFRPVQMAYGRAKRTHAEFAAAHDLPSREFTPAGQASGGRSVKDLLERAVELETIQLEGHADTRGRQRHDGCHRASLPAATFGQTASFGPLGPRD